MAATTTEFSNMLDIINRGSETFIRKYYMALDSNRDAIVDLFEPTAPIVFNGNPMVGGSSLTELYKKMPVTTHDVTGHNCIPLAGGVNGLPSVVLTVEGKVRLGTDRSRGLHGFSETLVLRPQADGRFLVGSTGYRYVYKSDDTFDP
ncbi:hypothetical protein BZA70DRAFT_274534 [Myxozyma melibiosi]|uniref:NTF2-related export protein n=1 Tax=Myxozyma melibiosi TaxID=54550 RepID=A0ABR1FBX7_9ASCO